MRIAVANVKGGSGKTSLAALITLTLETAGTAILASDFDDQGALTAWMGRMKDSKVEVISPTQTKIGEGEISHEIGDFPPVAPATLAKMVEGWDVILAPCLPSPMDVQSLAAFITALPDPTRAKVVWNAVETSSLSRPETLAEMLSPHGIKAAKATIPRRACFRYAQLSGLKALDDAAMNAINSLTLEVFNMKLRKRLPLQEVYMPPRSMEEINAEVMKCAETEHLEPGDVEILSMYKLRGFGKKKEKLEEQARKAGSFEKFAAGIMKEAAEKAAAKTRREFEEKEKPQ